METGYLGMNLHFSIAGTVCLLALSQIAAPAAVDFAKEVAPIFEAHCVRCHNADEKKGKFSMATAKEFFAKRRGHDEAVLPGNADGSLLVELITPAHPGESPEMPEEGKPLTAEQVALIRTWIAEGATWPADITIRQKPRADKASWWSLQPLRPVDPPEIRDAPAEWQREPIDRFVFAALPEKGLSPSLPADRRTLIRRASYDLTGLPPAPEEVEAFAADPAPDAYERLIDRLLASPRYGERWGRHWLDVIRFGESQGFERNLIRDDAWPFRDYVIRSLNEDKPFDRFMVEHLAGDQLAPGDPAVEVGTGFLVAGPYDNVGNQDAKAAAQIRANTLDEMVSTTGAAFLGITLGCARCHDHKFDPIPQTDYYRVQAAFSGVEQSDRELATREQREARAQKQAQLDETRARIKSELAPLEIIGPLLPADEQRRSALLAQKAALDAEKKDLPKLPTAWIGKFAQPGAPAYLMRGGDPQKRGPEIAPASLAVLDASAAKYELSPNAPEAERRLALAKWIVAEDNPLTPRVLANRVWHFHFGTGIVDTPSDFGYMGGKPTHPALLDHLALRLKHHGWRLKPLHREIMLSAVYRQSSAWRKDAADVDAASRLLWRFPPRRLSAEELRDTMLSVSGKLVTEPTGGPGFRLYRYVNDNVSTYLPLDRVGPETYRRAVYHQNARASTVDLLSDFDAPDCAASTPRRASTTTPLQALTLFNHAFTLDLARHFAERLSTERRDDVPAQVRRAFSLVSGRTPTEEEESAATALISAHGLPAFCRALLNSNELLHVE